MTTPSKIKIQNIGILINGEEKVLTIEEARELYAELKRLFETAIYYQPYQVNTQPSINPPYTVTYS